MATLQFSWQHCHFEGSKYDPNFGGFWQHRWRCPGAMWYQLDGAAAAALRGVASGAESGGG